MSINRLFGQNDYSIYANNVTANNLNATNITFDNIELNGDLDMKPNKKITMDMWQGSDPAYPDHIQLWGSTYGLGITTNSLNIITDGAGHIKQNIGSSNVTDAHNTSYDIHKSTNVDSGSAADDTYLILNATGATKNTILQLKEASGTYDIKRDGATKGLEISQTGDSINSDISISTGTGAIIQNGKMTVNGDETLKGALTMRELDVIYLGGADSNPNFWAIYKNSIGAGNENLVFYSNGSASGQDIAMLLGAGELYVNGNETVTGTLKAESEIQLRSLYPITFGAADGGSDIWGIYKNTGPNNNLLLYQTGNALNQDMEIQTNGGKVQMSNMSLSGKLYDSTNSEGTAGQVLSSTGTATTWTNSSGLQISRDIFMNSNGQILSGNDFIGITGLGSNTSGWSFPRASTITNIFVQINVSPGSGNSWDFIIRRNGVDTSLIGTLAGPSALQINQSGSVSFNAGDNFDIRIQKNGSPGNVTYTYCTVTYQ